MHWKTRLKLQLMLFADRLFGTNLVERELTRHQARIAQLDDQLAQINRQLQNLAQNSQVYQTALYLTLLKARSERPEAEDWLQFRPEVDGEERLLQGLIDCLVKPRLAAIDVTPLESPPNAYTYRLRPDWPAVRAYLGSNVLAPELEAWILACELEPGDLEEHLYQPKSDPKIDQE